MLPRAYTATGAGARELACTRLQAAIARLEAGVGEPRLSTLERIAEVLGAKLIVELVA